MAITREEVAQVAYLSRLEMDGAELDKFTGQLQKILDYAGVLDELDVTGVEPTSHAVPLFNVLREDAARPGLSAADALAAAPESAGDYFSVPKIIDEGEGH